MIPAPSSMSSSTVSRRSLAAGAAWSVPTVVVAAAAPALAASALPAPAGVQAVRKDCAVIVTWGGNQATYEVRAVYSDGSTTSQIVSGTTASASFAKGSAWLQTVQVRAVNNGETSVWVTSPVSTGITAPSGLTMTNPGAGNNTTTWVNGSATGASAVTHTLLWNDFKGTGPHTITNAKSGVVTKQGDRATLRMIVCGATVATLNYGGGAAGAGSRTSLSTGGSAAPNASAAPVGSASASPSNTSTSPKPVSSLQSQPSQPASPSATPKA